MELALFYGEIPEEQRKEAAGELHQRILGDAGRVMYALCDLCEHLKIMRDQKLYREMGLDSFDRYVEEQVGIKARQAYNYISTYEKLGRRSLQSNAHLGITKLALLAEVPDIKRADFAEDNDLEGMSVREIKELVAKSKQQAEQISLLQETADKAGDAVISAEKRAREAEKSLADMEREYRDAVNRAGEAAQRIRELEARPIEVIGITEDEKEKLLEEAEARHREEMTRLEQRYQDEQKSVVDDVKTELKAEIEQLKERHRQQLEQISAADKPKFSSVEGIMREANVWFESWLDAFRKMKSKVSDLQALDPEKAGRVREIVRTQMQKEMEEL